MKAGATVPLLDDNRYTTFDSNGQKGSRPADKAREEIVGRVERRLRRSPDTHQTRRSS